MTFEYKPIKFTETRRIEAPQHPINHNVFLNWTENKVTSLLERLVLGIKRENLEIYESTYKTPITSEYPENNVGVVRHYKASDDSAVIVLPQRSSGFDRPLKSSGYSWARLVAYYFAANGISAYEIETPYSGSRRAKVVRDIDLKDLKNTVVQGVTETRGLIDLIEEKNIGICGISGGAIYANIVYGVDDRVSSACLIMGGGNLADLFAKSKDRFAVNLRGRLAKSGITIETLRKELQEIEPCNYTNPEKSSNLLMINTTKDEYVPLKYQELLGAAWGNPKVKSVPAGHFSIVVYSPKLLPKILEHFKKTLK